MNYLSLELVIVDFFIYIYREREKKSDA